MDETTFFGHKKVSQSLKQSLVDEVFSKVAGKYDLMNDMMSLGTHRLWKDSFCNMLDKPDAKLLDVAGGTGDIAARFYKYSLKKGHKPDITLCDLNLDMMNQARIKHLNNNILGIKYINGQGESLPFPDQSFDYYTVAFGIRNFANIEQGLLEAKRVLKKGGKFLCLEFSKPTNPLLNQAYKLYSDYVIPNMGSLVGDRDSYAYLVESIEKFPSQEEFEAMIKSAGFSSVSYRNLSGGIVAIHTGYAE